MMEDSISLRVVRRIAHLYKLYVKRDPHLLNITRWFRDRGDITLRLDYPLNADSVVVDLGGYIGDFAAAICSKYGCRVHLFEPVPEYFRICRQRFSGNSLIQCHCYGLAATTGEALINIGADSSSIKRGVRGSTSMRIQLRSWIDVIAKLRIDKIDLLKVNIEGGEFDLLPALIESGAIRNIRFLQIQFHDFLPEARTQRDEIRSSLIATHREMWNYEFVWESWERHS